MTALGPPRVGRSAFTGGPRGTDLRWLLVFAWSHAVLGLAYLLVLIVGLHSLRGLLACRNVRRGLDAATGTVLLGFSARLATEHF